MRRLLFPLITITLLLTQCASRKEIIQFKQDMVYLQQNTNSIQQDIHYIRQGIDAQHAESEKIRQALAEMREQVLVLQDETSRTKAELLTETGSLRAQSSVLDGKLEDDINRLSQFIRKIESRNIANAPKDTTSAGKQDVSPEIPVEAPEELYKMAYLDFSCGMYSMALEEFHKYLIDYPGTELAADARYWIGEIYYSKDDFTSACDEFTKVVADYPQSERVVNALLKLGICSINLNQAENANKYLNQIIQRFPQSEEAGIAQEMLNERP